MCATHKRMARLPALVTALATVDGRDPSTLKVIARAVREAGLIATTKRGSGASEMTVNDAVNLIIGSNAVQSPRFAVIAVQQYRTYKQAPHGRSQTGRVFGQLAQADTLADALAVLIAEARMLDAMFIQWVETAYERPYQPVMDWILKPILTVAFAAGCVDIKLESPNETRLWRFQADVNFRTKRFYPDDGPARHVTTTIHFPMFLAIHDALFGEDHQTAAGSETGAS